MENHLNFCNSSLGFKTPSNSSIYASLSEMFASLKEKNSNNKKLKNSLQQGDTLV